MGTLVDDDIVSAIPRAPGTPRVNGSAIPQSYMELARQRATEIINEQYNTIRANAARPLNAPPMAAPPVAPPPVAEEAPPAPVEAEAPVEEEAAPAEQKPTTEMDDEEFAQWREQRRQARAGPAKDASWFERYVSAPMERGYESTTAMVDMATGDTKEYAEAQRNIQNTTQMTDEDRAITDKINAPETSLMGALKLYAQNPRLAVAIAAESLPASMAPLLGAMAGGAAGTAVGGPVGTAVGTVAGGFAGSFAVDYQSSLQEAMVKSGLDVTNPEDIARFYSDPTMYAEFRKGATAHAIPVAVFDTLSLGIAGRFAKMAEKSGLAKKALAQVAEVASQAGMGGTGEAAGQLAESGKITSGGAIAGEIVGEGPAGAIEAAVAPFGKKTPAGTPPPSTTPPGDVDPAIAAAVQANAPGAVPVTSATVQTQANATARDRARQVVEAQQQAAAAPPAVPGAGGGAAGATGAPNAGTAPPLASVAVPDAQGYKKLLGEIDANTRMAARAKKELEAAHAAGDQNAVKVAAMRLHVAENALAGLNARLQNIDVASIPGAQPPAAPAGAPQAPPGAPGAGVAPVVAPAAAQPTDAEIEAMLAANAGGIDTPVAANEQVPGEMDPLPAGEVPPEAEQTFETTPEAPMDFEAQLEDFAKPGSARKGIYVAGTNADQMDRVRERLGGGRGSKIIEVPDHLDPEHPERGIGVMFTRDRGVAREYDRLGRGEKARQEVLGYVEPKTAIDLNNAVVVERTNPDGSVAHGQVVSPEKAGVAVDQQEAQAEPDQTVEKKPVLDAQVERALRGHLEGMERVTDVTGKFTSADGKPKRPSKHRQNPPARPLAAWVAAAGLLLDQRVRAGHGYANREWVAKAKILAKTAERIGTAHDNAAASAGVIGGARGAPGARPVVARISNMLKTAEELRAHLTDVLEGRAAAPKVEPKAAPKKAPERPPVPPAVDSGSAGGGAAAGSTDTGQPTPTKAVEPTPPPTPPPTTEPEPTETKEEKAKRVAKEREEQREADKLKRAEERKAKAESKKAKGAAKEEKPDHFALSYRDRLTGGPRVRSALAILRRDEATGNIEFRAANGEQITLFGTYERIPDIGEVAPGDVLINGRKVGTGGSFAVMESRKAAQALRNQAKEENKKTAKDEATKEKGGEARPGKVVGGKGELELVSRPAEGIYTSLLELVEGEVLPDPETPVMPEGGTDAQKAAHIDAVEKARPKLVEQAAKARIGELLGNLPDLGLVGALFSRFRRANRATMTEAQASDLEEKRTPEQAKAFQDIVEWSAFLFSDLPDRVAYTHETLAKLMAEFPGGAWPQEARTEWLNLYARLAPIVRANRAQALAEARAEREAAQRAFEEEARRTPKESEAERREREIAEASGMVVDAESDIAAGELNETIVSGTEATGTLGDEEAAAEREAAQDAERELELELQRLIETQGTADDDLFTSEAEPRVGEVDDDEQLYEWGLRSLGTTGRPSPPELEALDAAHDHAVRTGTKAGYRHYPLISDMLEWMATDSRIPASLRPLARKLSQMGLKTYYDIVPPIGMGRGYYDQQVDTSNPDGPITLRNTGRAPSDRIRFYGGNKPQSARTVLHEATHAASAARYATDKVFQRRVDELFNHVKQTVPEVEWRQFYGMSTPEEFISEAFTNTDFQSFLAAIQVPERLRTPNGSSVWTALVKAVQKALGLESVRFSVLEEVLKVEDMFATIEHVAAMPGTTGRQLKERESAYNVEAEEHAKRAQEITNSLPPQQRTRGYGFHAPPATPAEATQRMGSMLNSVAPANTERPVKPFLLGLMLHDYLLDYGARLVAHITHGKAAVQQYIATYRAKQHDARMTQQMAEMVVREARSLSAKDPAMAQAMAKVAHDATIFNVSPDKTFAEHTHFNNTQDEGRAVYNRIVAAFNALTPEAKRVYTAMRDHYANMRDASARAQLHALLERGGLLDSIHRATAVRRQVVEILMRGVPLDQRKALIERAFRTIPSAGSLKISTLTKINEVMEESGVQGDYFPISRHGQFVVEGKRDGTLTVNFEPGDSAAFKRALIKEMVRGDRVTNPGRDYKGAQVRGDTATIHFEEKAVYMPDTEAEAFRMLAQLRSEGYTVENSPTVKQTSTPVPKGALTELLAYMEGANAAETGTVREAHIKMMADANMRKSELARRRIRGGEDDFGNMLRTFAERSYSGAWSLASLKHIVDEQQALAGLNRLQKDASSHNAIPVGQFVEELKKRRMQDLAIHQNTGIWPRVESFATRVSFVWYLGSLSHAITNATQPFLVALPIMGGEHGMVRTARKLASVGARFTKPTVKRLFRALGDTVKLNIVHLDDAFDSILDASNARGPVRDMLKTLVQRGVIDSTMVTELARAVHTRPSKSRTVRAAGHVAQYIEGIAKVMPQLTEIMNRVMTATAAFELSRERGASIKVATDYAEKMTRQTQGNYGTENLPRLLKMVPGFRVVGLYKTFGMLMYGLTLHTFNTALFSKTATAQEKRAAKKAAMYFAGVNGALLGVVGGLFAEPLRAIAFASGLAMRGMGWDDDEDDEKRKWALMMRNPDIYLRKMFADWTSDEASVWLSDGALSATTGIEWGQRVGFGHLLWQPMQPSKDATEWLRNFMVSAAGPVGGLFNKGAQMMVSLTNRDYQRAAEYLLPKGAGDILKASRLTDGGKGIEDASGTPILSAEDASGADVIKQGLGFSPMISQQTYATRTAQKTAEQVIVDRQQGLMDQYIRLVQDGKQEEADDLRYGPIADFNRNHPAPETRITGGKLAQRRVRQRKETRLRQQGKFVRNREAQRALE